ncbi:MAG: glycosyltransferase family 4 protein [Acidobacteriota bacterium]
MKRLLVVANDFPYPPTHGAAVDMWNRILILREMGFQVDLLATVREAPVNDAVDAVRERVGTLWTTPRRAGLRSLLSVQPFQVRSRSGLREVEIAQPYDAVLLEAEYVAPFLDNPAAKGAKLILRVHNEQVGYFRDLADGAASWLKKLYYLSESLKFRPFTRKIAQRCDLLWFISDSEREDHVRRFPQDARKSFFLPTHVNPSDLHPFSGAGKKALFIGSLTISHNTDSVEWYIANVHPRLNDVPDYAFQIAGRTAGGSVAGLRNLVQRTAGAALEENPETLDGLYREAAVFVNPVIRGAGVKIKVVQAIQAGVPVVSTSMGIEGTGFLDRVHVLVGDSPSSFADCVRRVLTEPGLAESLVGNAQAFVRERYDMKSNMQKALSGLLREG